MSKKKRNIITIKEEDFKDSKFNTKEWEQRVNIVQWEHNYVTKEYIITIE